VLLVGCVNKEDEHSCDPLNLRVVPRVPRLADRLILPSTSLHLTHGLEASGMITSQASLFFRDQKICYIGSTPCLYVFFWQRYGSRPKMQKHTTGGIPRWSPTLVLVARFSAYVWQSGRDAQFSLTYGRMCWSIGFFQSSKFEVERSGHGSQISPSW
jgi:hypothetical protein